MFDGCVNLLTLDVSNFDTRRATDISNMFCNCYKIEYLNLSNFDTSSVDAMFMLFYGCKSLRGVDISSFDTSNVIFFHLMFYGCVNLEFLNITHFVFNRDIVIYYDSMFDYDENLHLIITADFYYNIIDMNEYLEVIDENVTIIY